MKEKELVWLGGTEIETPPFSSAAKREAGFLIRSLQRGKRLSMPVSDTMPEIGKDCHELRIRDENTTHRVFYAIRAQAILVLEILPAKKTRKTPKKTIHNCRQRLALYEEKSGDNE